MSSNEDDDPGVCDYCDDIFLTKSGLAEHIREKHETPSKDSPKEEEEEEKPKRKMGPASRVKRARSSSDEEEEKVVKKVKMGPASRVKRDRSSSPENSQPQKSVSPVRKDSSRSASPEEPGMNIDKLVEGLASTESEPEKKDEKPERSRSKEKGDESRSDKHKMKKKKKHKDRDRDREKERSREKDRGGESKKKHKDKDKERHKENGEKSKNGADRDKERPKMGPASKVSRARSASTSDDEESNRRRQEEAKARWQKKQDEAKGRLGKMDRGSADSRDFIVSDDEGSKKMKGDRDLTLSDLIKAKKKSDHDKPKHFSEKNDTPKKTAFPSQGTVAAHDNDSGPECPKCGQVCKDNSNLKNHVLSHYYQVFYNVLPDSKPFPCPICGNCSRDKITMVRHYAFTHKKLFEMTDVTPEDLQGFGTRPSRAGGGKTPAKKKEKIDSRLLNDSSDDEGDKKVGSFTDKNMERLKEKYKEADEKRHKEHKHKDHKHKKEKKHKKDKKHKKEKHRDRDKDRDRDGKDMSNPLSSLLKEMTPDSSSSEPVKAKVGENGDESYRNNLAPTQRVAHVPSTTYQQSAPASYEASKTPDMSQSPVEEQRHPEPSQDAEESDDEFDMDLPAPVFA